MGRARTASAEETQDRYHAIFDTANALIVVSTPEGRIVDANDAFFAFTGYSRDRLDQLDVRALYSDAGGRAELLEALRQTGEVRDHEARLTTRTGEQRWLRVSARRTREGGEERILAVAIDITRRKEADEALHRSEERLRAVTAALPDVVFVLDEDGRYVEILTADKGLLARDASELKGRRMHDVLEPTVADTFLQVVLETLESGRTQVLDYELDVVRGHRHFEARTAALDLSFDGKRAVVFVTRDVTDRQLLEELETKTHELEAFNEAMVGREGRIIELKEEVNRLARELGRSPPYQPVWDTEEPD